MFEVGLIEALLQKKSGSIHQYSTLRLRIQWPPHGYVSIFDFLSHEHEQLAPANAERGKTDWLQLQSDRRVSICAPLRKLILREQDNNFLATSC